LDKEDVDGRDKPGHDESIQAETVLAMPPSASRKDDVIQIRASAEAKALLNRAAALRGQKLSEFILESARRQAEETILDQNAFFLDEAAHAHFVALLDFTPETRLTRKAPWEA
jgi:uncharacterized protein (DUF1778 family)